MTWDNWILSCLDKVLLIFLLVPGKSSTGDGTYFLQEYMIPRDSTSICLYDTRCLSGNPNDDDRILHEWMTKGVSHGELILRYELCNLLIHSLF